MDHLTIAQQNVMNSPSFLNNVSFLSDKKVHLYVINEPPKNILPENIGVPYLKLPTSRTAILVLNSSLDARLVKEESNMYVTTVTLPDLNLKIRSIYITPPSCKSSQNSEALVFPILDRQVKSTLILGDVNATSSTLGDVDSSRGSKLISIILSRSLILLNNPSVPTRKNGKTAIDWSMATSDIASNFSWSCTKHDKSTADHCLIIISSSYEQTFPSTSRISTYIDGNSFIEHLLSKDRSALVSNFTSHLEDAVNSSLCNTIRNKKKPFFDEKCAISKRVVRSLLRKVEKHGSRFPNLAIELQEATRIHQKNVAEAKDRHWANQLKRCKTVSNVYGLLKANRIHTPTVDYVITEEGTLREPAEVSSAVLNKFFPQANQTVSLLDFIRDGPKDSPITSHEVSAAFKMQITNTPGIDKVNLHITCLIDKHLPGLLQEVFNLWFTDEHLPLEMKCSVITLIKKDNQIANHMSNLRPISLVSIIVKLYERILLARMLWHMDRYGIHTSNQFGFTPGMSVEDCLRAISAARNSWKGTKDILIALDVQGAFNNVSHSSIVRECIRLGFPRSIINIIIDYLTDRSMCISLDPSVKVVMGRGVPQGTILGPLLFRLAMDVFARNLSTLLTAAKMEHFIALYADDCTILLRESQFTPHFSQTMVWLLTQANTILQNIGLNVNMAKTQISSRLNHDIFSIGSTEITTSANINILGLIYQAPNIHTVHLSTKLDLIDHTLDSLKSYITATAVTVPVRMAFLKSSVYSKILFASDTILSSPIQPNLISRFLQIDRKTSTFLFGSSITISYRSAITLLGTSSLLYCFLLSSERKRLLSSQDFSDTYDVRVPSVNKIHPRDRIEICLKQARSNDEIRHPSNMTLAIYTDGSKSSDAYAVTAAFVTYKPRKNKWKEFWYKLPPTSTAFQAERHAVLKATSFIEECCEPGIYHLLSDSLSVLQALKHPNPKDIIIARIQQSIVNCMFTQKVIHISWVKGHCGIQGNEIADQACRNALASYMVPEFMPLTLSLAYKKAETNARKAFSIMTRSHFTQDNNYMISSFDTIVDLNLKINYYTAPFYSNRAPTKVFLYRAGLINDELCPCGQPQTTKHLLISCPLMIQKFDAQRVKSKLPDAIGRSQEEIFDSKELHSFLLSIASSLLSWLEASNGYRYNDVRHLPLRRASSFTT